MSYTRMPAKAGCTRTYPNSPRSTQGEDLDEARAMVKDAIALVLEERRARGEPIPQTGWALVEPVDVAA